METYIRKLKRRISLIRVWLLITVLFILNQQFNFIGIRLTPANHDVASFQLGLILGIEFLAVATMMRYIKALKGTTSIELLYNQEHDERQQLIRQKSGMPMLMITSTLLLVAGVIAGYFNATVFLTLVIAGILQLSTGALIKLFYMKTY